MNRKDFGKDFSWGVATSSFQIEGANDADGKIDSIWDTFTRIPGKIWNGDNAEYTCDHYRLWKEDFNLLKKLGVNSYRFSISWPRIVAEDLRTKNQKGLDFYKRQINYLLSLGITPFLTLNHWDIPQKFLDKGGWSKRECIPYFLEYINILSQEFNDIIHNWITHNEPWVISYLGYKEGTHAPGCKSFFDYIRVNHHLLLSHGLAVPIIKENSRDAEVGIVLNLTPAYPASKSPADKKESILFDQFFNKWFLDPLYGKEYPAEIIQHWQDKGDLDRNINFIQPDDYKIISTPTDFLGVNYYSRAILRSDCDSNKDFPVEIIPGEKTKFDWEVFPEGLEKLLIEINNDYDPKKIYITENGASYDYDKDINNNINDIKRVDYLESHLLACLNAVKKGVPLKGYFHWSLMDNFEWAEGYKHQFGLVHIDFKSFERIPKLSYNWYKKFLIN